MAQEATAPTLPDDYHRAGCGCGEDGCHAADQSRHIAADEYDGECCVCNVLAWDDGYTLPA